MRSPAPSPRSRKGVSNIKSVTFSTIDGRRAECGIRLLNGLDESLAMQRAIAFALERGGKGVDDDPLYELGKAVHLVAIACIDTDDKTFETTYFDGGVDQILKRLDTETIFLLKERQRAHQEEAVPGQGSLSLEEYVKALYDSAAAEAGAELPFESWPLRARRHLVAFYGKPACRLTCAQIGQWLGLRNEYDRAVALSRKKKPR